MALKVICEGRREKWRYHAKQRVEMAERHPTFQLFGVIRVWEFPMNQIKRLIGFGVNSGADSSSKRRIYCGERELKEGVKRCLPFY